MSVLRFKKNTLILASIGLGYFLWLILFSIGQISYLPPCIIKSYTGVSCFACGTNHAFLELATGNYLSSWNTNPLAIILILTTIIYLSVQLKKQKNE